MLYEKKKKDTFVAENAGNPLGEMLEWLKRHAWKACKPQKGFGGSNPPHSATDENQFTLYTQGKLILFLFD